MTIALATIDDVKTYLDVKGNGDDELLTNLLASAATIIAQFLNRDPMSQVYNDVYDGSGNRRQVVSFWPITAVSSVSIDGVAQVAAPSVTANGFRFDKFSVLLNFGVFCEGIQNVAISYTAGYALAPDDLKQACVDITSEIYRRRSRVGLTTQAMAGGGGSTSYSVKDLPDHVKIVLNSYKKMSPV
jgi:hypothetical protein